MPCPTLEKTRPNFNCWSSTWCSLWFIFWVFHSDWCRCCFPCRVSAHKFQKRSCHCAAQKTQKGGGLPVGLFFLFHDVSRITSQTWSRNWVWKFLLNIWICFLNPASIFQRPRLMATFGGNLGCAKAFWSNSKAVAADATGSHRWHPLAMQHGALKGPVTLGISHSTFDLCTRLWGEADSKLRSPKWQQLCGFASLSLGTVRLHLHIGDPKRICWGMKLNSKAFQGHMFKNWWRAMAPVDLEKKPMGADSSWASLLTSFMGIQTSYWSKKGAFLLDEIQIKQANTQTCYY